MSENETPAAPASALLAGYVPEHEVARARGVGERALRAERQRGEGPPFVKIGRSVYYPEAGFREWLRAIEQRPVRAGRAA